MRETFLFGTAMVANPVGELRAGPYRGNLSPWPGLRSGKFQRFGKTQAERTARIGMRRSITLAILSILALGLAGLR
jgi:hypothetical protein